MQNDFYLLTPEFWAELEKNQPVAFNKFKDWLNDYKLRINWCTVFKANVDFYDLPIDLQHGILARFYFEAGEIEDDLKRIQGQLAIRTRVMFSQLVSRLKELNKI